MLIVIQNAGVCVCVSVSVCLTRGNTCNDYSVRRLSVLPWRSGSDFKLKAGIFKFRTLCHDDMDEGLPARTVYYQSWKS